MLHLSYVAAAVVAGAEQQFSILNEYCIGVEV
jgi:hypothetical protein